MFFFFNDTATTEIYTLSLHDALPISTPHTLRLAHQRTPESDEEARRGSAPPTLRPSCCFLQRFVGLRSEEHTSELQSRQYLVCRLLLEKKKITCRRPSGRT